MKKAKNSKIDYAYIRSLLAQHMRKEGTNTAVIVFIKNPELGKVKTRLAKSVGDDKALAIYMQLMEHTRLQMLGVEGVERYVFYSSFVDEDDDWLPIDFKARLQVEGDLGDKIKAAFREVFEVVDQAIIIGSDCAQLDSSHIQSAVDQLEKHDVVIGPTLDGGYYLLGMNGNYETLFEDINWSTETVLQETIDKANQQTISVKLIDKLSDIDYIEDWEQYGLK